MHVIATLALSASIAADNVAPGAAEEIIAIPAARAVAPDNVGGVPTNASIFLISSLLRPGELIDVDIDGTASTPIVEMFEEVNFGEQLLRAPLPALAAGATVTYVLPNDFQNLVHTFDVGDADDFERPAPPQLAITVERVADDVLGLRAHHDVVISTDANAGVAAIVVSDEQSGAFALVDTLQPARRFLNGDERELCLSGVAIDFAGNRSTPSETRCIDVEAETSGCASTNVSARGRSAGAVAPLVIALALLRVRRRSRSNF